MFWRPAQCCPWPCVAQPATSGIYIMNSQAKIVTHCQPSNNFLKYHQSERCLHTLHRNYLILRRQTFYSNQSVKICKLHSCQWCFIPGQNHWQPVRRMVEGEDWRFLETDEKNQSSLNFPLLGAGWWWWSLVKLFVLSSRGEWVVEELTLWSRLAGLTLSFISWASVRVS